jgi:DNA repair protein RadC
MSLSSLSSVDAVVSAALLVRDVDGQYRPASADEVLHQARRVLSQRVRRGATMSSPQAVKDYLRLEIGALEHEVFCVLFLDAQHRIIALKQMFRGTVTQTSVYPREVVKESLALNAAAVIRCAKPPHGRWCAMGIECRRRCLDAPEVVHKGAAGELAAKPQPPCSRARLRLA